QNLDPDLAAKMTWLDTFGVDSEYDYDPFWQECVTLRVAVTAHMAGHWGTRTSISNYSHNHIGLFASGGEALSKSLFFAGVTRRFPKLSFAFLEGGVSWAASLFADLVSHWQKRNIQAVDSYDPRHLDSKRVLGLLREHAPRGWDKWLNGSLAELSPDLFRLLGWEAFDRATPRDEWERCALKRAEEIIELFVPRFYFGCEGEEAALTWALKGTGLPFGARLRALYGSDIGHWDVPNMA